MNGSGRASANTRAVAPFRNHGLSLRVTRSRTKTEPITPPNCNASRWGHRTPMLAMNAVAFSYSAAVIPLLAWISTRSPMAGLN